METRAECHALTPSALVLLLLFTATPSDIPYSVSELTDGSMKNEGSTCNVVLISHCS